MTEEDRNIFIRPKMNAEKCNSNSRNNSNVNASLSHGRTSASILQLDIECFEKLLDWLSLDDLKILRETCKQMKDIIDNHIKVHYPSVRIGYRKVEHFRDIESNCKNLIKEIRFLNYKQKFHKEFKENEKFLTNVECVRLFKNCVDGEFYDVFLKFCPNLKCISIARIRDGIVIGSSNEWLLRSYPTLDNLKLLDFLEPAGFKIVELRTFFELNPNIRSFWISLQFLEANGKYLMGTKSKLEQLCVIITTEHNDLIANVINLLNELHRDGFYRSLYLYINCLCTIDTVNHDVLASMQALEKIRFPSCERFILPPLPGLKELKIGCVKKSIDWKCLSKSLINVERVYIENGTLTDIEPFICHFEKLKHIKVGFDISQKFETTFLTEGQTQDLSFINYLSSLNEKRKNLVGACKTTIYINENMYLAFKWTSIINDFASIELKRSEAFEWKNHCWYELNDSEDKLK